MRSTFEVYARAKHDAVEFAADHPDIPVPIRALTDALFVIYKRGNKSSREVTSKVAERIVGCGLTGEVE